MTAPSNVAAFHADYDTHPDDRIRLFSAVAEVVPHDARVLYPGSYVDIAPSVWFDDVTYVDTDKRAAKFFDHADAVARTRRLEATAVDIRPNGDEVTFHHLDYRTPLPEPDESFDLLVSLYAGFVSEHCTNHLRVGGTLLVNPSHGDAAMASIDPRYELTGVVTGSKGDLPSQDRRARHLPDPQEGAAHHDRVAPRQRPRHRLHPVAVRLPVHKIPLTQLDRTTCGIARRAECSHPSDQTPLANAAAMIASARSTLARRGFPSASPPEDVPIPSGSPVPGT